jgi:tRNA threonylcarbamoyladenosine biosynthesis protein TsaE
LNKFNVKRLYMGSAEEVREWASKLAISLKGPTILALQGDLGAGKTTFAQGFLQGLHILDWAQSPTFTYLQIYDGDVPVYHFDLYRLKRVEDFIALGFEEFLFMDGIVLIEWPERIAALLPPETLHVRLSYSSRGGRELEVGVRGKKC